MPETFFFSLKIIGNSIHESPVADLVSTHVPAMSEVVPAADEA
jgi:hypothetical protein